MARVTIRILNATATGLPPLFLHCKWSKMEMHVEGLEMRLPCYLTPPPPHHYPTYHQAAHLHSSCWPTPIPIMAATHHRQHRLTHDSFQAVDSRQNLDANQSSWSYICAHTHTYPANYVCVYFRHLGVSVTSLSTGSKSNGGGGEGGAYYSLVPRPFPHPAYAHLYTAWWERPENKAFFPQGMQLV